MSEILLFRNVKKPIGGGGLPLVQDAMGVAYFSEDFIFYSGTSETHRKYVQFYSCPATSREKTEAWIEEVFGDSQPTVLKHECGTAYKRICWPLAGGNLSKAIDETRKRESFVVLQLLLERLTTLFETIEPTTSNQGAYGHVVRELFLLACMEVESSWAAVLRENGYPGGIYKTGDYFKLKEAMLLDAYSLSLRSYPQFPAIKPFQGWRSDKPTQSLPWYDAYNKTKHDRERNLCLATLENAVSAVAAVAIMFYAQFDFKVESALGTQPSLVIREHFTLHVDFSNYPHSFYVPNVYLGTNGMRPVEFSNDWRLVNYPLS